jgi:hypothetical protein
MLQLSLGVMFAYWGLVGICPENWPRRWPPRVPPPPPPWWSKLVGLAAGVASGWAFTGAAGIGGSSPAPMLEFAATGAFALAGAYAARSIAARAVPVTESEVGIDSAAAFR